MKRPFRAGAKMAGAGVQGAQAHGAKFTENTGDVVNNIYRKAEDLQRNFFRAFVSEEDSQDTEGFLQIDGSFGSIGPGFVCLRVEMAERWELRVTWFLSRFFMLIITAVIIALIVLKAGAGDFSDLVDNPRYFIWNVTVSGVCLCLCGLTLGTFVYRFFLAKRAGLEWSHRRWRLSFQSLALLIVQVVNLSCMIGGLGLLIPSPCRWRNYASAFLGLVQWTCWNTTFAILVAMAHSLTILRRKKKATGSRVGSLKRVKGTQLVMDAPILTVHWGKSILWVFFQVWPSLLLWSFWGYVVDFSSTCSSSVVRTPCTSHSGSTFGRSLAHQDIDR